MEIFKKYQKEAKDYPEIKFVGRLAEYKYYDMDTLVDKILRMQLA